MRRMEDEDWLFWRTEKSVYKNVTKFLGHIKFWILIKDLCIKRKLFTNNMIVEIFYLAFYLSIGRRPEGSWVPTKMIVLLGELTEEKKNLGILEVKIFAEVLHVHKSKSWAPLDVVSKQITNKNKTNKNQINLSLIGWEMMIGRNLWIMERGSLEESISLKICICMEVIVPDNVCEDWIRKSDDFPWHILKIIFYKTCKFSRAMTTIMEIGDRYKK